MLTATNCANIKTNHISTSLLWTIPRTACEHKDVPASSFKALNSLCRPACPTLLLLNPPSPNNACLGIAGEIAVFTCSYSLLTSSSFRLESYKAHEAIDLLDKVQEKVKSKWKHWKELKQHNRDIQPSSETPVNSSDGSGGIWMQIWCEESPDNANPDQQQTVKTRRIVIFNHERTIFVLRSKQIKEDLLRKSADHDQCKWSIA